jgi:hypothetical protein
MMTYLHHKKTGAMGWTSRIEAKGKMWATPGPYLRRSMLTTLARKVSDHFLPEAFYEETTFTEAEGCAARSAEEEDDLALSLTVRMREDTKKHHESDSDDNEAEI